jgi:glycosyltransferase involved in cell wall biosynthesis
MRILYVRDGITAHDRRFLDAIVAQGHVPIVVEVTADGNPSSGENLGVTHVAARAEALSSIAAEHGSEVAHVGPLPSVGALAADNLPPRLPLVGVSWGSDVLRDCADDAVRRRALRAIDRANVLLVDCEAVQQRILDWRPTCTTPFVRFPWGIDPRRYAESSSDTATLRTSFGWADNDVFISTRSWEPAYGIDVLLAAFALVVEHAADARLLLIGDGSLRPEILADIQRQGLAERVQTPGRIPEAQLPAWYTAADLYVSSSPCDGTSVSLLEAMASRLPAIVHEQFGNIEWIRPGENGWLADCLNPASLAAAMRGALRARARWAEIGRANRARAIADADWTKNSLLLTEAYRLAVRHAA